VRLVNPATRLSAAGCATVTTARGWLIGVGARQDEAAAARRVQALARRVDGRHRLPDPAGDGQALAQAQEELTGDRALHRLPWHLLGDDAPPS
jgi:hypothetical protein